MHIHLTQRVLGFALLGAEWVMWLLLVLSVASIAVMIERWLYYRGLRVDFEGLVAEVSRHLGEGNVEAAKRRVEATRGVEAAVVRVGLAEASNGAEAADEAMTGARARERLSLERNLAFLGTLGSNAPFIGLFGTVIGVIKAFHDLSRNTQGGTSVVSSGISEALVATAIGLFVAIPAVVAYNVCQRKVRSVMAQSDALSRVLLAHLRSTNGTRTPAALLGSALPDKAEARS